MYTCVFIYFRDSYKKEIGDIHGMNWASTTYMISKTNEVIIFHLGYGAYWSN